MSATPELRRVDKLMSEERIRETILGGYCGRLASVGSDGWPYVIPLLYVSMNHEIWVHNAGARGHFRSNVESEPKVCFEIDEPGEVFAYGRFECDTSIAYRCVIVFGRLRIVDARDEKALFFDAFMRKYGNPIWNRPKSFYPRLDDVTVYALSVERMTGKETPLPRAANRWPAVDNTRTPGADPGLDP